MTITIIPTESGIELHGFKPSQYRDPVTVHPLVTATGGPTEDVVVKDALRRNSTPATTLIEATLHTSGVSPAFESLDTSIATVASNGVVTRVANGTARILAKSSKIIERVDVPVSLDVSGTNVSAFLSWEPGTLGKAIEDIMWAAMADANVHNGDAQLSIPNEPRDAGHWNPNNWAIKAGFKMGPIPVYNDLNENGGWAGGACAIHPRFIVVVHHYTSMYSVGRGHQFRTPSNVNVMRYVTDRLVLRDAVPESEIVICLLDDEIPEECGFAKVLPANWPEFISFPTVNDFSHTGPQAVPAMERNRYDWLRSALWYTMLKDVNSPLYSNPATDIWTDTADGPGGIYTAPSSMKQFKLESSVGDSSNAFTTVHPITKELIYLNSHGAYTEITQFRDTVNAWMDSKVCGASLTDADFSAYPNYGA